MAICSGPNNALKQRFLTRGYGSLDNPWGHCMWSPNMQSTMGNTMLVFHQRCSGCLIKTVGPVCFNQLNITGWVQGIWMIKAGCARLEIASGSQWLTCQFFTGNSTFSSFNLRFFLAEVTTPNVTPCLASCPRALLLSLNPAGEPPQSAAARLFLEALSCAEDRRLSLKG